MSLGSFEEVIDIEDNRSFLPRYETGEDDAMMMVALLNRIMVPYLLPAAEG